MAKWILISMAIGMYVGIWIITTWILIDKDSGVSICDVLLGFVWPLVLVSWVIYSPFMLVWYIVDKMPRGRKWR